MDYALKERENQEFFKKQIKEDEELLKQIKKICCCSVQRLGLEKQN